MPNYLGDMPICYAQSRIGIDEKFQAQNRVNKSLEVFLDNTKGSHAILKENRSLEQ